MDLGTLKKLAGIDSKTSTVEDQNVSHTATALKQKERKLGLKPGDPDWFKLWFSRPYLQGSLGFRGRKK
tara:strand:- start:23 stop:229 length:207 start_codon:yes stop_codon:yes gene_type:complete